MLSFHRGEVCHESLGKTQAFVQLHVFINDLGGGGRGGGGTHTKFADYAGLCNEPL